VGAASAGQSAPGVPSDPLPGPSGVAAAAGAATSGAFGGLGGAVLVGLLGCWAGGLLVRSLLSLSLWRPMAFVALIQRPG
jgi:tetrahydromethanopterin S-methyltransferase subunit B